MRKKSNLEKLEKEILRFWQNYHQSREIFFEQGDGEDSYEYYNSIKAEKLCKKILQKKQISKNEINCILELMAIENESQTIQYYCRVLLSEQILENLFKESINFPHYHARWQIAELIGQTRKTKFENYLEELIQNKHKYVQRRAILAFENLNIDKFEKFLYQFLTDSDGYNRAIYLRNLQEIGSKNLEKAIELLENDDDEFVKRVIIESKLVLRATAYNCG
jgi:hypothetical protein